MGRSKVSELDAEGLTLKQRLFVEAYDGNGVKAARLAGYKGNDATLAAVAWENLRKAQVKRALQARRTRLLKQPIASRVERQAFWTRTMNDGGLDTGARLKASELLGRSEADFTDNVVHRIDLDDMLAQIEPADEIEAESA